MAMKRTSLSFLTIIILILSSSCASLNQNSAKKVITTAIKAKIDFFSKEFQKREEKTKSKANVNKGKGQQSVGSFLILADYFTFAAKLFEGLNA